MATRSLPRRKAPSAEAIAVAHQVGKLPRSEQARLAEIARRPFSSVEQALPPRELIADRITDLRTRLYNTTALCEVVNRSVDFEDDNYLSRAMRQIVGQLECIANDMDSISVLSTEGGAA